MLELMKETRHDIKITMPSRKPYENNLHHIVVDFIKGDYDFWLNMDSDNPPLNNPIDLADLNKDIIGLPTPVSHFDGKGSGDIPVYLNAYDYVPRADAYRPHGMFEGLRKIDAVGTGCVLFARRVFEHPEMQKGCFTRKLNSDGTVDKGNDISFCERARENGFEIYTHYNYMCDHFSELSLREMNRHYMEYHKKELTEEINGQA